MNTKTSTTGLYSLGFSEIRSYLFAALFIAGNVVFPQLCHLYPQGGLIMLPIYFFTLVAAYKYGLKVGLLTAVLSPVVNHVFFGMPPAGMLPIILIKSTILAVAASLIARKMGKVTLIGVTLAVVAYQLLGGIAEWGMTGSINSAMQDIWLGYPGIFVQILGGYITLKYLLKK